MRKCVMVILLLTFLSTTASYADYYQHRYRRHYQPYPYQGHSQYYDPVYGVYRPYRNHRVYHHGPYYGPYYTEHGQSISSTVYSEQVEIVE
ncbi:MAG: hypothetical protein Q8Q33_08705 [Chlamydiota bacterium]|nr:hypothetical protein [Chlamydiota bacterium]